ncbi:MAG: VCBS repeat-containing protein, partial [Planctomycetota bacterium]
AGVNDPVGLVSADFNGDGLFDLVSGSRVGGTIGLHLGIGGGNFANISLVDGGLSGLRDVKVADVRFDGLPDLVVASSGLGGVRWYENLGGGFFGPPNLMPDVAFSPTFVAAADFDSDCDLDFANSIGAYNPDERTIGTSQCPGVVNSSGLPGRLEISGTDRAELNSIALKALDLPNFAFGFFLTSADSGFTANPAGSEGNICLSGAIGRYVAPGQIMSTGPLTTLQLKIDLTQTPDPSQGLITVTAGETRYFQLWHRDTVGGVATSNFTEASFVMLR